MAAEHHREQSIKDKLKTAIRDNIITPSLEHMKQQTGKDQFILVCDRRTVQILELAMTQTELTELGAVTTCYLDYKRAPIATHAIYLISPTSENVERVAKDLVKMEVLKDRSLQIKPRKTQKYTPPVYIFFTQRVMPDVEEQLAALLSNRHIAAQIGLLSEVPIDFNCIEDYTFTCGTPNSFSNLFGMGNQNESDAIQTQEIKFLTNQLLAAIGSLSGANRSICVHAVGSAAEALQGVIEPLLVNNEEVDENAKQCYVTLIDRSFDPLAPLMHDYGYQSAIHDHFNVDGDHLSWIVDEPYGDEKPADYGKDRVESYLMSHKFFNVHEKLPIKKPNGRQFVDIRANEIEEDFFDRAGDKDRFVEFLERTKLSILNEWTPEQVQSYVGRKGPGGLVGKLEEKSGQDILDGNIPALNDVESVFIEDMKTGFDYERKTKGLKLNEKDELFLQWRYLNYTDVYERFQERRAEFQNTPYYKKKNGEELPKHLYMEMMRTYKKMEGFLKSINAHNHIIRRIRNSILARDTLEFDITVASGYSDDVSKFAERCKTLAAAMALLKMLLSAYDGVSAADRLRFVMVVVAQHGCLSGNDLDELMSVAQLGNAERDAIKRMASVGVTKHGMKERNATYHEARKTYCKEQAKKGSGERYAPLIKYFLEKDAVNQKTRAIRTRREARLRVEYDIICKMDFDAPDEAHRTVRLENFKDAWQNLDGDGKYSVKQITKSFNKLQSGGTISWEKFRDTMLDEWEKPTGHHIPIAALNQREHRTKKRWGSKGREAARKEEEESPWILFFLGGVSFNEIRQIRLFAERENRNVYIGATEILSAGKYMDKFIQSNSTN